ncbi:MAG TPA: SpoIIE family protein phosphatase [Candidatus Baltobacteraceae bacterium]|nr:SpoIIE family protein phosphatase [Candidatus Baltobacteraceae bacterium]
MSELELNSLARALEADSAEFRIFANALPNFVWLSRAGGSITFFNDPLLEYTGVSQRESLEDGLSKFVHPQDRDAAQDRWRQSLRTGTPYEAELRLRRADGSYRWFLTRALPIRGTDGKLTHWIGTFTDIDSQRRARETLSFVIDASGLFASALSLGQVCNDFARLAVQRFADWCFVVVVDPVEGYKVAAISHRDFERVHHIDEYLERYPVTENEQIDRFLHAPRPTLFPKLPEDLLRRSARDEERYRLLQELQLYSAIVAPLRHNGDLLGGIIMYSGESRRSFTQDDVDVLEMLADRAAARIHTMKVLDREQRERRRLQFLGRATQAVYESFDLTTAFGNLAQIIVSEVTDMAAVFRLEDDEVVRVVGTAHRDPEADDAVRSFVGIRVMHGDAEKRFIKSLHGRRPLVGTSFEPGSVERTVWPYLSEEIASLRVRSLVTVPLYSRGKVYGAIVAYYTEGGREYKPEDLELLVELGRHASVAMENADVFERERRLSETLQDSLLPPSLPQVEGITFDAVYLPSAVEAQVGGDWYDAFKLEDGTIVVSAGDVTGRGPDAAVIMGKTRHLLAIAPSYERDPARILDTVESVLARRYPDTIVTAFLGFISPDHRSIRFANAGHPAPIVRRGTIVEELQAEGLPIGLRHEAEPSQSRTADLSDARMLVLYTDGLTESGHDVLRGTQKLREVVTRDALLHTHRPARFIEEACLGNAATDDVAVLALSFEPGIRWSFDAENAKAAQDARGEFVEYLREQSSDEEAIETAELVFGELVGNVVRHAPGAIDIDVEWSNGAPRLHVLDRGSAFEPPSHLPSDLLSESGRGLYIVRNLSKQLNVEHVPGYGNHVSVELPIRRLPGQRSNVE